MWGIIGLVNTSYSSFIRKMDVNSENIDSNFHILALSGGGYKGLYTASIIARTEEMIGRCFGGHFDLICGTSIGGIIALALATREISAQRIVDFLQEVGPKLFTPVCRPKRTLFSPSSWIDPKIYDWTGFTINRGVRSAKHGNLELKEALQSIFENRTISDMKTRTLIPTANWTKGAPQFFKTPHHQNFKLDANRSLVDIAMATSAAPIYLPNYEFENQVFVDGGLVGNAPGVFGVHEAETSIEYANGKVLRLLSIGALSSKVTADQNQTLDKGLLEWKSNLFDLMMACQERTSHYMLTQKMGERYHMVDEIMSADQDRSVALDKADASARDTLLGLAGVSFQSFVSDKSFEYFTGHSAPDLGFKNSMGN